MSEDRLTAVELALITKMRRRPDHWFTANKLAEDVQVSWERAEKHLERLHKKGFVVIGEKGKRRYWKLY